MDKQLETLVLDIERGLYEETPNGSIVTAHGKPYGVYFDKINDGPWQATRNTLTIEGINYWLETAMRGGTADSTFFIALYNGAVTPSSSWTGANFSATASEITSATEGYAGNRPAWTPDAAANGVMSSVNNPAEFTIAATTSIQVVGAALLSGDVRGGTSDKLISAANYSTPRTLPDGALYKVAYHVGVTP